MNHAAAAFFALHLRVLEYDVQTIDNLRKTSTSCERAQELHLQRRDVATDTPATSSLTLVSDSLELFPAILVLGTERTTRSKHPFSLLVPAQPELYGNAE
ncbi:hypothetical protein HYALB_00009261 [Hymenoscyphus albidus]|uniref:Uncharacterized protein n=1 Tax=Hymenoscyphus albidus TaxID=595503 RepID=A0A9N9LUS9_9HELO|nr:hypothetical protein HYALB_00009261 [Hymenoscyphus albidus]